MALAPMIDVTEATARYLLSDPRREMVCPICGHHFRPTAAQLSAWSHQGMTPGHCGAPMAFRRPEAT
jgi:hypothetical protein